MGGIDHPGFDGGQPGGFQAHQAVPETLAELGIQVFQFPGQFTHPGGDRRRLQIRQALAGGADQPASDDKHRHARRPGAGMEFIQESAARAQIDLGLAKAVPQSGQRVERAWALAGEMIA